MCVPFPSNIVEVVVFLRISHVKLFVHLCIIMTESVLLNLFYESHKAPIFYVNPTLTDLSNGACACACVFNCWNMMVSSWNQKLICTIGSYTMGGLV